MKATTNQFFRKLTLLLLLITALGLGATAQSAAIHFDGAIGNYDYITVPDDNSLDMTNSVTLEAWINFDQITVSTPGYGWRALFTKASYFNSYGLMIYAPAGASRVVRFYHEGLSVTFTDYVWTTIVPDTWYHIAVTYDGTEAIIYLDGVQVASQSVTGSITQNNDNLNIGFSQTGLYPWDGKMDEVRVWNVARTEMEINTSMNSKLAGSETGLVLYYNFDEGSPGGDNTAIATVTDGTSSGNNGTLTGFALTGGAGNFVAESGAPTAADFELIGAVNEPLIFNTSDLSYADLQLDPLQHMKIVTLPSAGTLYLDANADDQFTAGEEISLNQTVGLSDLDAGNLQYINSSNGSNSFTFSVSDGVNESLVYTATLLTNYSIVFDDLSFTDNQDLGTSTTFTNNGQSFVLAQSTPQSYSMTYQDAGTDYTASGYAMLSNASAISTQMGFDISTEDGSNVNFESIDLIINGGANQGFNLNAYNGSTQIGTTQVVAASTNLVQTIALSSDFDCANRIEILVTDISGNYEIGVDNIVWSSNAAPVFTHGVTEVAIDENSTNGTEIIVLTGSDADNDPITFDITAGNDDGAFAIDNSTGSITVDDNSLLDFETTPTFNLTVSVSDGCETVTSPLTVNLNNISPNDFCTNAITITAGTTVAGSTNDATGDAAIAPNCGSNLVESDLSVGVWYHFVGTGEKITVSTCGAADYDTGLGVYQGSCTTGLTCIAGNDDGESCSGNTSIVSFISTLDQDYFILVDGYQEDAGTFSLTTTAEPAPALPSNDNCSGAEVLTVFAEGTGTPTNGDNTNATNFTEVVFCDEYANINDVWYTFNSGPNVRVAIDIQLTDTDDAGPLSAAGFISYEVYLACGGEQQDVCNSDGTSNLTVTPNTDYYLQLWNNENDRGTFTIQINDGPNTAATVNSSTVSLSRFAPNGEVAQTVTSTDTEGHSQSYSFTAGNDESIFAIDAATGEVIVVDDAALAASATSQFVLTVEAADQGPGTLTSTGTLTIDIIDNQFPTISAATVALDENSANATPVTTVVASDADMDNLSFSILSGNTGNAFAIDALGEITVNDVNQLDFETNSTFDLEVQVTDDGPLTLSAKAVITVNLNDVNELPMVGAFTANISQNNTNGYLVSTIDFTDEDADQMHTFSISAGNTNSIFSIDPTTGEVTIANETDLAANGATTYNLDIEVADNGTPVNVGTGTLAVNVFSNNIPTITPETFMVDENTANSTPVGTVAGNDVDGDGITFSIFSGNDLGTFSITPAGEIQVADVTKLDFEANPLFELNIQVQDDGAGMLTSTGLIAIQLNDVNEAPSLGDVTLSVSSSSADGTVVSTLAGTDPENDALTYSVTAGNDAGVFAIDAATGQLTVANGSLLNPAITPQYNLTVEVSDGTLTGSASVTVNVYLNETPSLSLTALSLDENSAVDYVIGTLSSNDADGIQSFAIVAGNDANVVALDASTGALTVNDAAFFNYETVQAFDLTIRLTDNGLGNLQNTEVVSVSLNDVNEFSPVVSSSVNALNENATTGTVATVSATDDDIFQTLSYSIISGNTDNAFAIDNSGVVTISNTTALDFETNPSFMLIVEVSDSGAPANASQESLTVNLTDVNEAPMLSAIGNQMGDELAALSFTASGSDVDAGTSLTYSLDATSISNGMSIDASTGVFSWTPTEAQDGTFSTTVTVSDGSLEGSETITITVAEVNMAPVLAAIGNQVGAERSEVTFTATATDADLPANTLQFSLDATSTGSGMVIDPSTGTFTWTPGSTQAGSYTVIVSVSDGTLNDAETITIEISDVLSAETVNAIEIYPNPTSDYLQINSNEAVSLQIFDLNGAIIQEVSVKKRIDVTNLKTGVYMLRLINKEGNIISTNRIVKQ